MQTSISMNILGKEKNICVKFLVFLQLLPDDPQKFPDLPASCKGPLHGELISRNLLSPASLNSYQHHTLTFVLKKSVLPLCRGNSSPCPVLKRELPHRFLPTTWLPTEELFFGFMPDKRQTVSD